MCACNTTPCGKEYEDGGEAEASQKGGKRGKGKKEDDAPPPTWQERIEHFKKLALKLLSDAHKFCKKIEKDPFQRQVVKSTVYYSLGLKLFSDLARHLAPKPCGSQM